ncbi:hypothetical protein PN36_23080 [Candidatus Thiomargarita nelsonii]|uniref:HTH cro/C1-type domain-containing protein n=1 Tax=Candidatus Thiomargarita nelsonii TaxID=1003181 RepID=A0A4E0QNI8_9GAMM|nr:hypothetical protein PN36_23080 [Candidatus Thiomargarita nelsonii]
MNITKRKPPTPGEILSEEFMVPLGLTQNKLAEFIQVPRRRINEIINNKRSITPDTAIRLSKLFGTSADLWLNLQHKVDLWEAFANREQEYKRIEPIESIKSYLMPKSSDFQFSS